MDGQHCLGKRHLKPAPAFLFILMGWQCIRHHYFMQWFLAPGTDVMIFKNIFGEKIGVFGSKQN
jgi:hypothetical protein